MTTTQMYVNMAYKECLGNSVLRYNVQLEWAFSRTASLNPGVPERTTRSSPPVDLVRMKPEKIGSHPWKHRGVMQGRYFRSFHEIRG